MKTVYVFGNPLVREDSVPLKILGRLKKRFPSLDFVEFDTTEDLEERDLVILDTVKGIRKVKIIDDVDKIVAEKVYSMHDFDLGQNLRLMKKMKMVDSVVIIGVPMGMDDKKAFAEVCKQIEKIAESLGIP